MERIAHVLFGIWVFTVSMVQAEPAHAMFFSFLVGPLMGALGISAVAATVLVIVGALVLNSVTGGALFGKKRSGRQQQKMNIMVNKQGSNDDIPVVYGRSRVGGSRVYVETSNGSGDTGGTTHLNIALAMCEGEMGDLKKVYFNDTIVWDSTNGGTVTNNGAAGQDLSGFISKYANYITMQYFPGRTDQTVSSVLQNSVGSGNWSNNHRMRGVGYLAVKLQANTAFNGSVPTITAEMAGKRIQNVANISQGSGSRSLDTSGESQNPVDVLYDYLVDKDYGKGLDHDSSGNYSAGTDIDLTSFKSMRTHAASVGYKIDGYLGTEDKLYDNVEEILDAFNALLVFINGKYKLIVKRQSESSVKTVDYDDITSEITVGRNVKQNHLNKISITFHNPGDDEKYNEDVLILPEDADSTRLGYLTEDNNTVLETQIEQLLVTDETILKKLGNYKLDASRRQMTVSFTGTHRLMNIEPGEIITLQNDELGFSSGKLFRVLETSINTDNTVSFTCGEYNSSIEIA